MVPRFPSRHRADDVGIEEYRITGPREGRAPALQRQGGVKVTATLPRPDRR
ncbi:hypothetical protein [Sphingopyxis sp.]|uniref:hypothetical protein n=1 Tax=Sphingopyxis sp. TaxID=1908224 RepID=UPI003BAB985E